MKNNVKLIKTVMAGIGLTAAVVLAGCGDGGQNGETVEGTGAAKDEWRQEASAEGSDGQEGGAAAAEEMPEEAYLNGIRAEDYVKLGEYKGIELTLAGPEVTDEQMDSYIDHMLCINPDRAVIEGDTVNIDYAGTMDGVAFDGGTASGQDLQIGSGGFIAGFEDGLIGVGIGETVELNLTFPEDYYEELAGKDVVFTVTVNSITAAEPQELTDEYVQRLDIGLDTVDEYRQYVYDLLYEDAVASHELEVEDAAMAAAFEQCEFTEEPPQAMVERHVEMLMSNLASQSAAYGLTLAQMMQMMYGMDEDAYQEEFRNQAVEYAKQQIMIKAIADAEGLQVTEEEFRKDLETLAESGYGTADELMEAVDAESYKEYMLGMKVLELLRENAVVKEG